MAQYIYQMHGMFEMHFTAFIGSAILITYQNWKLQIPLAIGVLLHHAILGYLQFIGYDDIYFTQEDYMDLQTFLIHGCLASVIFLISGVWAYDLKKANLRLISQSQEVSVKSKNIIDSIHYSRRIQTAMLSPTSKLEEIFPNSFIFSKPKDIVSGDFFWCYQTEKIKIIAVADCTGHGVPGALMSIVCNNLMNEIIVNKGVEEPAEILYQLDSQLHRVLENSGHDVNDGMDISILVIHTETNELFYAGAYRPLFYIDEKEKIVELKGNPYPIGGTDYEHKQFTSTKIPSLEGRTYYLSSDGYYSQFGGPRNKKFMKKQFREMIGSIKNINVKNQSSVLSEVFHSWQGDIEQTDDVLVIGIQI
ncbi:Stage II sporulation protein E (SpoIIE) [compost metagenome]